MPSRSAAPIWTQRARVGGGCQWVGMLSQLDRHVNECPFMPVPCPRVHDGCDVHAIERRLLDRHVAEDCIVTLRLQHEERLAAEAAAAAAREEEAERRRRREQMLADLARVSPPAAQLVRINVGGTFHATVDRAVFAGSLCPRDSLLGTLFDPTSGFEPAVVDGEIFIHRDGGIFSLLLRYLIEGAVPAEYSPTQMIGLRAEAAFWRLPPVVVLQEDEPVEEPAPPAAGIVRV